MTAVLIVLALSASADRSAATRGTDLTQLHLRASEFDPEFQRSRLEREIVLQSVKESRAGLLPGVSASAEATKVYQDIRESNNFLFSVGQTDFYNTGYTISLTQPIYRMDVFARVPQARAELRQADALYAAAEQDMIFRLAQAFFSTLAARENLEFAAAERQAIVAQMLEAEQRLGSGLVTISDVQDLRGRAGLAQAEEIKAEDSLAESRQAIAEITGEAPGQLAILGDSFPLVVPEQSDVESWVRAALFQNARLRAFQAAVESAQQEVRRQRGGYMPSFDFVASYGYTDSGGTVFGGGNEIQDSEFGVRLAFPIFDGGRASARVQGATLRRAEILQQLEKERRRVERETRGAFREVVSGVTRVEALDSSVLAHQAALAVKEEGWRSGLNTGLIVLDARKELYSAKRDLALARYLYVLQSLKLKQAAGTLGPQDLRQIDAYLQ